jgi:hypothetical protein
MKTFRSSLWISLSATAYFLITPPVAKADEPATPTLISVSPSGGAFGVAVPVILTGANFAPGATVTADDQGVQLSNVTVVSSTQISLTMTAWAAIHEAIHLTVTSGGATSNPGLFTVSFPPPTLGFALRPASASPGSSGTLIVAGNSTARISSPAQRSRQAPRESR